MKPINKKDIIKLRQQHLSYNDIAIKLNISKSTVSYWLKNKDWSENIKQKLQKINRKSSQNNIEKMAIANRKKWQSWYQNARDEATKEFQYLKGIPLFIAGNMLYWGEGDSNINNSMVRLSNITDKIIIIFVKFLKNCCKVDDNNIIFTLILYPEHSEAKCKKFWCSKLPVTNPIFYKTQRIIGKNLKNKINFGICNVLVKSRFLKEKIITWENLLFGSV